MKKAISLIYSICLFKNHAKRLFPEESTVEIVDELPSWIIPFGLFVVVAVVFDHEWIEMLQLTCLEMESSSGDQIDA